MSTTATRSWNGRRVANWAFSAALVLASLAWIVTLRPQALGGPADYVMVRGISMIPTYHTGDLVIVRREPSYIRGDIVAYRIPQGQLGSGVVVIHRVIGGSDAVGFIMKGDNNPAPDEWRPTDRDIVGKAWLLVPKGGRVLGFLHAPLPLASLATGVAVALIIADDGKRKRKNVSKD